MAEDSGREHGEHEKAQRAEHQPAQPASGPGGVLIPEYRLPLSGSLLGDPKLDGRGNQPVKVAVMRQMQQTYGNRAMQRLLHRQGETRTGKQTPQPANEVPIQRLVIQRSPLSDNVRRVWDSTHLKGRIFDLLRSSPQPATSSDTDLTTCLNEIFRGQPDDLWLANTIRQHGPEPLWPPALITERANRANNPAYPWAHEQGNIEATLGMTAGLPASGSRPAIPPSPVRAYFFPGRTAERALIIGGVHGAEQSGIEVVEALRASMAAATTAPRFTTILVPVLFPDNRAYEQWYRSTHPGVRGQNLAPNTGGRYSRVNSGGNQVLVEPNRNYPLPGHSMSTAESGGLRDPANPARPLSDPHSISTLLPETRMLLALIERFQPSRIASVHAHRPSTRPGDAPGIWVDPRGGINRTTDRANTTEGQADDALAGAMLTHARGLRAPSRLRPAGIPDRDNPGGSVHYRASTPRGTSLGDWAPVAVDEGRRGVQDRPGDRPAMTIVTVEVEDYFPSAEDNTGEMARRVEVHRDTLQNVFLERP